MKSHVREDSPSGRFLRPLSRGGAIHDSVGGVLHSEITLLHLLPAGSDLGSAEFGRSVAPEAVAERDNRARHNIDHYLRPEMAHLKVRRFDIPNWSSALHEDLVLIRKPINRSIRFTG